MLCMEQKMSTQDDSLAVHTIDRQRLADFPPSVWGDYFCKYADDLPVKEQEKIKTLEADLRKMFEVAVEKIALMDLIDQVQRLGLAYKFEEEIELGLKQIHKSYLDCQDDRKDDLYTVSLRFRLLRQQGYNISCDIFNEFRDEKGSFIELLANEVRGLLGLYEACHMRTHGEEILEDALTFSLTHLKASLEKQLVITPLLKAKVMHALNQPIRTGLPRVEARQYFPIYQQDPFHIDILLTLAKLDFNLVQKQHQEELGELSRWWKELNFKERLPFARDRLVECYFWTTAIFFEPQCRLGRKILCKVLAIITIIDDAYDAYGTIDELEVFAKAVQRWEIGVKDELAGCMQVVYEALLNLYDEIGSLLFKQGKSYRLYYAKEGMKKLVRGYIEEARWLQQKRIPSMEEYMSTALFTSTYGVGTITAFIGMEDIVTKDVLEWALTFPKIIKASATILRLSDDIASSKFERKREHIPSAVECYVNEHVVTEEEAQENLSNLISYAWKDINKECLRPMIFDMTILTRVMNFARAASFVYKGDDHFTNAHLLKDIISSLYIDSVPI